ncbi:MAG: hypothetical protein U5L09_10345 [Bacteroidales bacterium]|nr:hypothetical protein [Bacteroidales bacterium]
MWPIVKYENNKVMTERDFILEKYQQVKTGDSLTNDDKSRLLGLAMKYRVKAGLKLPLKRFSGHSS